MGEELDPIEGDTVSQEIVSGHDLEIGPGWQAEVYEPRLEFSPVSAPDLESLKEQYEGWQELPNPQAMNEDRLIEGEWWIGEERNLTQEIASRGDGERLELHNQILEELGENGVSEQLEEVDGKLLATIFYLEGDYIRHLVFAKEAEAQEKESVPLIEEDGWEIEASQEISPFFAAVEDSNPETREFTLLDLFKEQTAEEDEQIFEELGSPEGNFPEALDLAVKPPALSQDAETTAGLPRESLQEVGPEDLEGKLEAVAPDLMGQQEPGSRGEAQVVELKLHYLASQEEAELEQEVPEIVNVAEAFRLPKEADESADPAPGRLSGADYKTLEPVIASLDQDRGGSHAEGRSASGGQSQGDRHVAPPSGGTPRDDRVVERIARAAVSDLSQRETVVASPFMGREPEAREDEAISSVVPEAREPLVGKEQAEPEPEAEPEEIAEVELELPEPGEPAQVVELDFRELDPTELNLELSQEILEELPQVREVILGEEIALERIEPTRELEAIELAEEGVELLESRDNTNQMKQEVSEQIILPGAEEVHLEKGAQLITPSIIEDRPVFLTEPISETERIEGSKDESGEEPVTSQVVEYGGLVQRTAQDFGELDPIEAEPVEDSLEEISQLEPSFTRPLEQVSQPIGEPPGSRVFLARPTKEIPETPTTPDLKGAEQDRLPASAETQTFEAELELDLEIKKADFEKVAPEALELTLEQASEPLSSLIRQEARETTYLISQVNRVEEVVKQDKPYPDLLQENFKTEESVEYGGLVQHTPGDFRETEADESARYTAPTRADKSADYKTPVETVARPPARRSLGEGGFMGPEAKVEADKSADPAPQRWSGADYYKTLEPVIASLDQDRGGSHAEGRSASGGQPQGDRHVAPPSGPTPRDDRVVERIEQAAVSDLSQRETVARPPARSVVKTLPKEQVVVKPGLVREISFSELPRVQKSVPPQVLDWFEEEDEELILPSQTLELAA